jgi:hypothetical protein
MPAVVQVIQFRTYRIISLVISFAVHFYGSNIAHISLFSAFIHAIYPAGAILVVEIQGIIPGVILRFTSHAHGTESLPTAYDVP